MRTLTIEARSRDSADGFYTALKEFGPELVETECGEFAVKVDLSRDTNVHDVLNALVDHVSERDGGSAVVALGDERHILKAV